MEFEGQYLTYDDFRSLGGSLSETSFNLLEFEARKKIDKRTQMKLKNCDEIPQEVKICEYKMITAMSSRDESLESIGSGNIASENIDGYSVSYVTNENIIGIIDSKEKEINNIIETELFGVIVNGEHILYLGVAS